MLEAEGHPLLPAQVLPVRRDIPVSGRKLPVVGGQPQIYIDFPEAEEELAILKENLPFAGSRILRYVVEFLQRAHAADELYSVRDGINIARYALKMMHAEEKEPADLLPLAVERILGEEALRYIKS